MPDELDAGEALAVEAGDDELGELDADVLGVEAGDDELDEHPPISAVAPTTATAHAITRARSSLNIGPLPPLSRERPASRSTLILTPARLKQNVSRTGGVIKVSLPQRRAKICAYVDT